MNWRKLRGGAFAAEPTPANMEADNVAGKPALRVQAGAGIAEKVKMIEQERADMRRRLMAAMLASAEADEHGRRWAERQKCAPRPPID